MSEFFFSYARDNHDNYLERFFDDLDKAVRDRGGNGGFRDVSAIQPGENWADELADELRTAPVFIAILSPAYTNSEYCGKEWTAFSQRCNEWLESNPGQPRAALIPILWIPPREDRPLPGFVTALQYPVDSLGNDLAQEGLQYVCKRLGKYRNRYTDYVDDLAKAIISKSRQLPIRTTALSSLHDLPSAWDMVAPPPVNTASGPNMVHLVYAAAHPDELAANNPQLHRERYLEKGGRDWKPYFPVTSTIRMIARQTAIADGIELDSDELAFGAELLADMRKAQAARQPVVMFVDGWSAQLPTFRQKLQQIDAEQFDNCSVIVPRNEEDSEELEQTVAQVFANHIGHRNAVFFRNRVGSEAELRKQLGDVLTRLRAEIINKSAPTLPIPGGGTRPIISATGA
ncbi:TIR domain-containing protein [Chitinimonas naiadis]